MRLIPVMEIEMTGGSVPLKLSDPAITMTVSGELTATIKLTQQAANHNNTDLDFTFAESGGATMSRSTLVGVPRPAQR